MQNIADMTVYDPNGQLSMIIEVKNKLGASQEWAAKLRRNILAHGLIPQVKYFLLALPDHFYIWKDAESRPKVVPPTYDINPEPFLKPYYEKAGVSPEQLSGEGFELMLFSWMHELKLTDTIPPDLPQDTQRWLRDSGVFDTIRAGRIESEV